MSLVYRLLWALAVAVIVWLVCVFFGGFLALTAQPMVTYVGTFIEKWATLIAIVAFILAFVGGAPAGVTALFKRTP